MTRAELIRQIRLKKSFLCIGLDTDISKIPAFLLKEADPVFEFNKAIIEATRDFCVAYKPNIAFYESLGSSGWDSLQKTLEVIPPTHFTIADAKRGDIGNTATLYAKTFFKTYNFDSVTVAPYMGRDSIEPFLNVAGKWAIVLGLTSNPGAADFEDKTLLSGNKLYEEVISTTARWGSPENLMFVAGATQASQLSALRSLVPDHFLLIPGIGAQGGNLEEVIRATLTPEIGILVNASRSIIYASAETDFAEKASKEAQLLQAEMANFI
jgi:orotidine-5'-phosphate decarboxylase